MFFLLSTASAFLTNPLSSSSFDLAHANRTWFYASAAYCDSNNLNNWNCDPYCYGPDGHENFEVIKVIKHDLTGNQAFVGIDHDKNKIIASYRGSQNLQNGIEDLDIFLVGFPGGPDGATICQGFASAYMFVHDETNAAIKQGLDKCSDCTITFTGHSLGGAMAALGAVKYVQEALEHLPASKVKPVEMYTFGCPRVGNQGWVDYATDLFHQTGSTMLQMRREFDLVPNVPPNHMSYVHLPQEIWERHMPFGVFGGAPWYVMGSEDNGEDPNGYGSKWIENVSPEAHLNYLGMRMAGSC